MNTCRLVWTTFLITILSYPSITWANRFFVLPQVVDPRVDDTTDTENNNSDTASSSSSLNARSLVTPIKVAYQGEPGAYSEQAVRELLGPNVIAVARPNFEACYRAVACKECDYACLPIENSLGGSIHENYDLMLRYDLTIVAEHELRVSHCLHVAPGVKREDIKYAISHPQALAQCDNYLRSLGISPIPMYDTAGSAKLISEIYFHGDLKETDLPTDPKRSLPDACTVSNTAAIASALAGRYYKLECIDQGIEDDDTNFTRFLLLARSPGVSQHLNKSIPSKTSIVFTLANTPGALYKALACFSLRDIDFSKIESRPTSASLLNYLKYKNRAMGLKSKSTQADELPRFRYCFYLDFLANELDDNAQNALHHLREQAEFCRILGSYPQKSRLVGPIHDAITALNTQEAGKVHAVEEVTQKRLPSDEDDTTQLNIGIIGYGAMGQILAKKFVEKNKVRCMDSTDKVSLSLLSLFMYGRLS